MKHSPFSQHQKGFTLVELLVVVSIMAMMLGVAGFSVPGAMQSQKLSGAARTFASDLEYARLSAQRDGTPIEVRLYKYEDKENLSPSQFRSYQILKIVGWDSDGKPLYKPDTGLNRLSNGIVFFEDPEKSTLFSNASRTPSNTDPDFGFSYEYVSYQIRPDGNTNLPRNQVTTFTLVNEDSSGKVISELPPDYRTITLDPVTGDVRSY